MWRTRVRKAGWSTAAIGAVDWFGRYQTVRDFIHLVAGEGVAKVLSRPWLSPVILVAGLLLLYASRRNDAGKELPRADNFESGSSPLPSLSQTESGDADKSERAPMRTGNGVADGPTLRFIAAEVVNVDRHIEWIRTEVAGRPSLIAIFRNMPRPAGQNTPPARSVTANLTFKRSDGQMQHINFGTWLGQYTHFADFSPGQIQYLAIAVRDGDRVLTLDNPLTFDPRAVRFRSGRILYAPTEVSIAGEPHEVEVTLISRNLTVFQGLFRCDLTGDPMQLTRLDP
jgi:hypothetical protein